MVGETALRAPLIDARASPARFEHNSSATARRLPGAFATIG
jgi:hypothetical protein